MRARPSRMKVEVAGFLIAGFVLASARETQMSAEEFLAQLEELEAIDQPDAAVAAEAANAALTTRLPADALPVLQRPGLGPITLGPLTLRAVQEQITRSSSFPAPKGPIITLDSPPDDHTRSAILDRMSSFASNYVSRLPRFVCLETTRFFSSGQLPKRGEASHPNTRPSKWHLDQTITEELRYHDGAEEYRTKLIDDQPSTTPVAEVRSSFSRGEFGSILSLTFGPASQATFNWDHWENVRGKRMAVWGFKVPRDHSQYMVCCVSIGTITIHGVPQRQRKQWVAAYSGLIYADPESGVIRRLFYQIVDIPTDYDLSDGRTLIDFDLISLKSNQAWLPRHALHYTRQQAFRTKSEIDFSDYHSFEADSVIAFPTDEGAKK